MNIHILKLPAVSHLTNKIEGIKLEGSHVDEASSNLKATEKLQTPSKSSSYNWINFLLSLKYF